MSQNATKIVFGVPTSSDRELVNVDGDPASFPAGLALRLADTGLPSVAVAAGALFGVSAGKSLSEIQKLAVIKSGNGVPIRLKKIFATGTITITSFANLVNAGDDTIVVGGETFTAKTSGATGNNQFNASSSNGATRDNLLAKLQAHPNLIGLVSAASSSTAAILLTAVAEGAGGNSIVLTYTDNGSSTVGATVSGSGHLASGVSTSTFAVKGAAVYIDDVTGEGSQSSGSTISSAIYISGPLTGINEDSTEAPAALIDMGGGL